MRPLTLMLILLALTVGAAHAQTGYTQEGQASYYADKFHGRTTASGERYDANKMTCAHMTLPYGTVLRVTNQATGASVVVRVNDRGPFVPNRIIDLSRRAAEAIGMVQAGVVKVRIESVAASELERQSEPPAVSVSPTAASTATTPPNHTTPSPPPSNTSAAAPAASTVVVSNGSLKGQLPDGKDYFLRIVTPKGGQFGVQVASYRDVNNLAKAIGAWDYPTRTRAVVVAPAENASGTYKVVLGPYATRAEAETEQQALALRFPGCFIIAL